MKAVLLDRDGVIVLNKAIDIRTPKDLELIPSAVEGLRRLCEAGIRLAICTNQPEVGRGAMRRAELDAVHEAMLSRLADQSIAIEFVLACTSSRKCPQRKPAAGMLLEALERLKVAPDEAAYVGDQADDLKAAFHARCGRVLVRTGLGARTAAEGWPGYVDPVLLCEDLVEAAACLRKFENSRQFAGPPGHALQ
jgi:D-glycero-D-manno-heptose 1,7-bisphosphate phosphatase